MCPAQVGPKSLCESSDHDDQGPSTSASHGAGNQPTAPKNSSLVSAPVGAPSSLLPASPSSQPEAAQLLEHGSAGQATQSKLGLVATQKVRVPPGRAARSSQSPRKPFNSIIEHLSAVFPWYSRYGCDTSVTLPSAPTELRFPGQVNFGERTA